MTRTIMLMRPGLPAALALLAAACGGGSTGAQPPPSLDVGGSDAASLRDSSTPPDSSEPATVDGAPADSSLEAAPDAGAESGSLLDGRAFNVSDSSAPAAAQCAPGYSWKAGREWIADSIARFGGVSADGLTLAWTDTTGDVVTADRLNESSDFGAPLGAPPASVARQADGRVALDPSGTLLVGMDAIGSGFVVWQRTSGQGWLRSPSSVFSQTLAPGAPSGTAVSEPVFGASGQSFFYLLTPPPDPDGGVDAAPDAAPAIPPPTLYESRWSAKSGSWGPGVALTNPELTSPDAAHRRRPTGASSDDRTLFFFDEVAGLERAAWRDDASSPYTHFEDVPAAPEAAPNADCTLLYYRGSDVDAGTQGINVAQ